MEKKRVQHEMPPLKIKKMRVKILKMLKKLKPNKKEGIDKQTPRVLKEVAEEIVDIVMLLFDLSLTKAEVPSDWLLSVIAVIFKKGKKSLAGNYRPVSLTSIVCKLFESFIKKALNEHFINNNLLSNHQFGFVSGRSTVTQLLVTLNDLLFS